MTKPIRVQRSRQMKNMSPNGLQVVYVGRPTKWGNPFMAKADIVYRDGSKGRKILDKWVVHEVCSNEEEARKRAVELYRQHLLPYNHTTGNVSAYMLQQVTIESIRQELAGKNLSCWCKPGQCCHADVLLEIANSKDNDR